MSAATFGTPKKLERQYGKPLIQLPGSEETAEYDRASSFGKSIDNGAGLAYWAKCMVIKGASLDSELTASAMPLEYDTDKSKLHELAERAMTLAGAGNKASSGTAMHAWTDLVDSGRELPKNVPPAVLADLDAYRRATEGLEHLAAERFVVCDELRAAGSFDRLTRVLDVDPWPSWLRGKVVIGDLKTGNAEGAIAGIAVQLSIYARSCYYDIQTGERTPIGADQGVGLVIHLPLGQGIAQILAVDLVVGWEGALAAQRASAYQAKARLACGACPGTGYYKNGNPCRSCKGTPRVPLAVQVRVVGAVQVAA